MAAYVPETTTPARPAGNAPEPAGRVVRIVSDLAMPDRCGPYRAEVEIFPLPTGGAGDTLRAARRLYRTGFGADAIHLNQPGRILFYLCALRTLLPLGRARIVATDLIMNRPKPTRKGWIVAALKRFLLRRVDLFILHLKEPGALETFYGVDKARSVFIPFKINMLEELATLDTTDQGYILAPGRSWRDYPTFCAAMARLPYPARILVPRSREEWTRHGTQTVGVAELPPNVEIIHDDGTPQSWNRIIAGARVVALPIHPDAISAAGNSTYIQAMALGKVVVVSDCPGARGIIEDGRHALIVPQRDPEALAAALRRAWEDDELRQRIGQEGRAYALSLGDVRRFRHDLLRETIIDLVQSGHLGAGAPMPTRGDGPGAVPA